ncbi:hypothetical protein DPMN_167854 [Dreissena polymorpha]|uniref:Uncharacterized protein n=1 Tax=Dreissena polymorpha TaxID=45954 RepID=A0A9D4F0Z7_DREPO|nr:hypothetical protein DPMN_167854 [Dreissena polymorpha]
MLAQYRQIELENLQEQATHLRENATDINDALAEVENFVEILRNLAVEVGVVESTGTIYSYVK